jgi:hypothetical protein
VRGVASVEVLRINFVVVVAHNISHLSYKCAT